MRKLASVVRISGTNPIENSDRLEVAEMEGKGWRVVTQKGEFKAGDLAVYFEIDSALPFDDDRYEFLRERCVRKFVTKSGEILYKVLKIKTLKLRGVVSQGLLIPISKYPEITNAIIKTDDEANPMFMNTVRGEAPAGCDEICYKNQEEHLIGADVSFMLKVEHFDEVAERFRPISSGNPIASDAYGKFPSDWIPKTNEERVQNLAEYFTTMKGRKFEVTCKDDGSSVTMFYSPTIDAENPFGVCSRNIRLKDASADGTIPLPWQIAKKYDVQNKLKDFFDKTGNEYALQGELIGPGIQKNRDMYNEHEWHIFKIYDIKNQRFLLPSERREFCKNNGLKHVHVAFEDMDVFGTVNVYDEDGSVNIGKSMDALLKFAEGKTARGNEREGYVFKTVDEPSISFKAVSNRYLLKQED